MTQTLNMATVLIMMLADLDSFAGVELIEKSEESFLYSRKTEKNQLYPRILADLSSYAGEELLEKSEINFLNSRKTEKKQLYLRILADLGSYAGEELLEKSENRCPKLR